jgi:uncharacterized protein (DUF1501 family)
MNIQRRKFIKEAAGLSALGLAGTLGRWGIEAANAQAGPPYQALVCIFLFGGNDSNNMIIPDTNYASYATTRTVASGVQIAQANTIKFTASKQGGASFGFHPNLAPIAPLYSTGQLAIVANAGTLINPLTKAQYQANSAPRPTNLFSHSDQQNQWQGLLPNAAIRTGWAGRMADKLVAVNNGQGVPTIITVSGTQIFNNGMSTSPLSVPSNGGVAILGQAADAVSTARFTALGQLLNTGSTNKITQAGATVMQQSLASNALVNPILSAALPPVIQNAFTQGGAQLNTGMAQQLKQVARLIDARASLGVKRHVFFVSMGGYDTHSQTVNNQNNLFNQLAPAMKAFYDYTVAAGVANIVTTFTMSDFNRTFIGNGNQGVDHAWGGHMMVMGGAVKGGDMYGTFPDLTVKGPDDSGSNGAWIPTTSVDQVGGTLASWFGVVPTDVDYMFPNLKNFASRNIGFV